MRAQKKQPVVPQWLALKAKVVRSKTPPESPHSSSSALEQQLQQQPKAATFLERKLRALATTSESPFQRKISRAVANLEADEKLLVGKYLANLPITALTASDDNSDTSVGMFTESERQHYQTRLALLQRTQRARTALREAERRQVESPEHSAAIVFASLLREIDLHHHRARVAEQTKLLEGAGNVLEQLHATSGERESNSALSEMHDLLNASRALRESVVDATTPDEEHNGGRGSNELHDAASVLSEALESSRSALDRARAIGLA